MEANEDKKPEVETKATPEEQAAKKREEALAKRREQIRSFEVGDIVEVELTHSGFYGRNEFDGRLVFAGGDSFFEPHSRDTWSLGSEKTDVRALKKVGSIYSLGKGGK